jgi:fermentation-respiration switch protein FrsA (DUF1100 family)
LSTVLVLLGCALGFLLTGAVFCSGTLHVKKSPSNPPQGAEVVEMEANDRSRLSAWWMRSSKPNGNCVAVLHGIKDSRAGSVKFAPTFLNEGYSVLIPDSRAHGASGGEFVTYGLLEKYDILAWAHWMRSRGCERIYGLGESLGGSILIQASEIEPAFAAVVAECPFADLRELAKYRVLQVLPFPSSLAGPFARFVVSSGLFYARVADDLDLQRVSPMTSIAASTTPILLIHGLNDDRTPPTHSKRLLAANPRNALWLVPGAGHVHASQTAPDEFRERVLTWFSSH